MIAKSKKEKEMLRVSGQILARVLTALSKKIEPGIEILKLDNIAEREIKNMGARSSFKNHHEKGEPPYPASICVSVNEEIVHGIPGKKVLREGDVVSIDLGVNYGGFFTDAASTYIVGKGDAKSRKLVKVCRQALGLALKKCKADARAGDIGGAVESFVEKSGFKVFRELVGHGVGRAVHEPPQIPNWGKPGTGTKLEEGMVLAIEPMISEGKAGVVLAEDGWTLKTKDGSRSAHFEHTVLVKKEVCEILTVVPTR